MRLMTCVLTLFLFVPPVYRNILMNLQAGNYRCGVIEAFQTDRGGQWLMYRPNIPTDDVISPAGGN